LTKQCPIGNRALSRGWPPPAEWCCSIPTAADPDHHRADRFDTPTTSSPTPTDEIPSSRSWKPEPNLNDAAHHAEKLGELLEAARTAIRDQEGYRLKDDKD
jgi:hypothetical protein